MGLLHDLLAQPPALDLGERKAWRIPHEPGSAMLADWVLAAPGFYPIFDHFEVAVISLEARPEWPAPHLLAPDCVGEFLVQGLKITPGDEQVVRMEPAEVLAQIVGLDVPTLRQLGDVGLVAALHCSPPPIVDVVGVWHTSLRAWVGKRGGRLVLPPERQGRYRSDGGRPCFE